MSQELISPLDTAEQLDLEIIANPYPHYHQLRAQDPVHWSKERQGWNLTRYTDVQEALRDRRLSSDRMSRRVVRLPGPMQKRMAPIFRIFNNMMLMSDPPNHTRLCSRDPS